MKEIVDRILQEEELARKKIEKADREGQAVIRKAAEDSQKIIKESLEQSNAFAQDKKEQSAKGFIADKEKALKQVREQVSSQIVIKSKDIPVIAVRVFSRIIEDRE